LWPSHATIMEVKLFLDVGKGGEGHQLCTM